MTERDFAPASSLSIDCRGRIVGSCGDGYLSFWAHYRHRFLQTYPTVPAVLERCSGGIGSGEPMSAAGLAVTQFLHTFAEEGVDFFCVGHRQDVAATMDQSIWRG